MKNNNDFWFKRRRYGYGWIPTTWQGMAVIIVFLITVFSSVFLLKDVPENTYQSEVGVFLAVVFLSISALVFISHRKGPKPKWRWGKKKSDNPKLDF